MTETIPAAELIAGMTYVHRNGHRSIVADVERAPHGKKLIVSFSDAWLIAVESDRDVTIERPAPMVTLNASDHRAHAEGDSITARLSTVEAAHELAQSLNCGLYSITADGATTVWEWDGRTAPVDITLPGNEHGDITAAIAYQNMPHTPKAYSVVESYAWLRAETLTQWRAILATGLAVEFHGGAHNYPDSAAMFADLAAGHLYTYLTLEDSGMPADHPMAEIVTVHNGLPLMLNDVFRAVHDVNGHGRSGGSFGPNGERRAWLAHRELYSLPALAALWCETRGQAAWTNSFSDHASRPLAERPFAAQKAGMPPAELV